VFAGKVEGVTLPVDGGEAAISHGRVLATTHDPWPWQPNRFRCHPAKQVGMVDSIQGPVFFFQVVIQ
jgi:hypothetical protein